MVKLPVTDRPTIAYNRYIAALIELGLRDDTLIKVEIDAIHLNMTITEHLLNADGEIVLNATVERVVSIARPRPPEVMKG